MFDHDRTNSNKKGKPYMMVRLGTKILIVFLLFSRATGTGQLRWERSQVVITAPPAASKVSAEFEFLNAGNEYVTITNITSDCDCTTGVSSCALVQPGERGKISAVFTNERGVGGVFRKQLFVHTSAEDVLNVLSLEVRIPHVATVEPEVLLWDDLNPSAPKEFVATIADGVDGRIVAVDCDWPEMSISLKEAEAGTSYRLIPSFPTVTHPKAVAIQVRVIANGKTLVYPATLILRPTAPENGAK